MLLKKCGFAIAFSAGIENLPYEPMDIAKQKCSNCKVFMALRICSVISGMLRQQASHFVQSTFGASQYPFAKEFVKLHVVSKNVQSIRADRRLEDMLSEVALCQFDLLCLSECWRADGEECIESVHGDLVYLSGGCMYRGVGVVVFAQFRKRIEHVSFHAYGPRVCVLKFCVGELKCECFSVYFPTSWDTDVEVEGIYETLQLLLDNCRANGAIPIIGGDFNASIGSLLDGEADDLLGSWGVGQRSGRGRWLVQWILSNGLRVASRQKIADTADSWTCKRFSDGMFVQIDFILSDARISVESNWNDFMIPLGIDHRCVHCRLALCTRRRRKQLQQHGMKHWKPHMDEQG